MKKLQHFLSGKISFLRPVEEADFPNFTRWVNDEEVTRYMFYGQKPQTLEQVSDFFRSQLENPNNTVFTVCDKETSSPIGLTGLYDIHQTARRAEYRLLIGDSDYWSKGYGSEVGRLMVFYGFDRLNLHRIYMGATSDNKGAIKADTRAGFKTEGILKDDIYRNGRYYDTVRMAILRDEYYEKQYKGFIDTYRIERI